MKHADELQALLALHMVSGIGSHAIKKLVSYCGSAVAVFNSREATLQKIPGIGTWTLQALQSDLLLENARNEIDECHKLGINIISYLDENYPVKLKNAPDCPIILYQKGTSTLHGSKTLAIVGTRKASAYGLDMVDQLVSDLSKYKPIVISGLAYGIDVRAHEAALVNGLKTLAVLANGLHTVYPAIHRSIANDIIKNGSLVSETSLHAKLDPGMFPARNRIIAGLADAVVVVEAGKQGGALITADIANSYDREVFAIPGSAFQSKSEGCNDLIKSYRAHLVTSAADVVKLMNWDLDNLPEKTGPVMKKDLSNYTSAQMEIIDLLSENGQIMHIDEISWKSQKSVTEAASLLLQLELQGAIKPVPGKKYRLTL